MLRTALFCLILGTVHATTYQCTHEANFITGIQYDQISLTDACHDGVCDANPVYSTAGCLTEAACRTKALQLGHTEGGSGYSFAGSYRTKGCYTYSSGRYLNMAYFGTGGTTAEMAAPVHRADMVRIQCPANDNDAAAAYCEQQCDERQGCIGFFYQKHTNGHEICGFYTTDMKAAGTDWVQHGHASGSRVCQRPPTEQVERQAVCLRYPYQPTYSGGFYNRRFKEGCNNFHSGRQSCIDHCNEYNGWAEDAARGACRNGCSFMECSESVWQDRGCNQADPRWEDYSAPLAVPNALPPAPTQYSHCNEKIAWMKDNWRSNAYYAEHGVDGSDASIRKYLGNVEMFCPPVSPEATLAPTAPPTEQTDTSLAPVATNAFQSVGGICDARWEGVIANSTLEEAARQARERDAKGFFESNPGQFHFIFEGERCFDIRGCDGSDGGYCVIAVYTMAQVGTHKALEQPEASTAGTDSASSDAAPEKCWLAITVTAMASLLLGCALVMAVQHCMRRSQPAEAPPVYMQAHPVPAGVPVGTSEHSINTAVDVEKGQFDGLVVPSL